MSAECRTCLKLTTSRTRGGDCRGCYMKARAVRLGPCAAPSCDRLAESKGLCNTCYQWQFRRVAQEFINEWKSAGCVDCGPDFRWLPTQIDADHIDGKSVNISRILHGANARTLDRVRDELTRCVPRCKNHHRQVTRDREAAAASQGPSAVRTRRYVERRMAPVLEYKASFGWACQDCGGDFSPSSGWHPSVLELDHLPAFEKVADICLMARRGGYSAAQLTAELMKTEPVCACCHILRTVARDLRPGLRRFIAKEAA